MVGHNEEVTGIIGIAVKDGIVPLASHKDEAFRIVLIWKRREGVGVGGVGFGRKDIGHAPIGVQTLEGAFCRRKSA